MFYLDEMRYFLQPEWELAVEETTVWRALDRSQRSRKTSRKIAR